MTKNNFIELFKIFNENLQYQKMIFLNQDILIFCVFNDNGNLIEIVIVITTVIGIAVPRQLIADDFQHYCSTKTKPNSLLFTPETLHTLNTCIGTTLTNVRST